MVWMVPRELIATKWGLPAVRHGWGGAHKAHARTSNPNKVKWNTHIHTQMDREKGIRGQWEGDDQSTFYICMTL